MTLTQRAIAAMKETDIATASIIRELLAERGDIAPEVYPRKD